MEASKDVQEGTGQTNGSGSRTMPGPSEEGKGEEKMGWGLALPGGDLVSITS
jgi:hypothetical protein